ncbi:MAG TPA: hypothetical protein VIH26_11200 [Anaerolineales bacterium]
MGSQPLIAVTRRREIRPEGAEADSQAFRDVALRLRDVAETFRGHTVRLGLNWAGRASGRFMEWLLPVPNRLDALASEIDVQAGRIDHRTVTIIETVMVPPPGTHPD